MTIFFLPIEPLEERYTAQMLNWVVEGLTQGCTPFKTILPDMPPSPICVGQFLDVFGTIEWKAKQISTVADLFRTGVVKGGDKFLVGDLWFPGLSAIGYMASLSDIQVEVWGWHYAGVADPFDFVQAIEPWAGYNERGWLEMVKGLFVGSEYHKALLVDYFGSWVAEKVYPIGLAWDLDDVLSTRPSPPSKIEERPKRIIFPHRAAPEKGLRAFYRLAKRFANRGWDLVITSSRQQTPAQLGFEEHPCWRVETGLTKAEYYILLGDSRVFFSAAYQETFGYALQEAIAFGVAPVCPWRCSYPEVLQYDLRYLYHTDEESYEKVERLIEMPVSPPTHYTERYDCSTRRALVIMGAS